MELREMLRPDATLPALAQGYAWLPDLRRRSGDGPVVRTRLMGRPAVVLHGPEAVRFFYDEEHVRRRSALPGPVLDTLFGRGAVHTLDGQRHRARKALFVSLLKDPASVDDLAERAGARWDEAAAQWAHEPRTELFTEAGVVITRAVCDWAGVPYEDDGRATARDLVAMVDGFATAGPRHLRARRARARQEQRLGALVEHIRSDGPVPADSALHAVAVHRDADGGLLDPHTAAVEVLNVIRPTAAVSWYVTFAAHALHRWPHHRELLRTGGPRYAEAFAHELRRFYPFVPFLGGLAAKDLRWRDERIDEDTLVLLDVYGHHHDPDLWPDPYVFDPARFEDGGPAGSELLIPQGGGDAATGHRCPGEDITVALLRVLSVRLARLDYGVPPQDLSIPLSRTPTRPADGFLLAPQPPTAG
jgi:fatty-acid peroxygenase